MNSVGFGRIRVGLTRIPVDSTAGNRKPASPPHLEEGQRGILILARPAGPPRSRLTVGRHTVYRQGRRTHRAAGRPPHTAKPRPHPHGVPVRVSVIHHRVYRCSPRHPPRGVPVLATSYAVTCTQRLGDTSAYIRGYTRAHIRVWVGDIPYHFCKRAAFAEPRFDVAAVDVPRRPTDRARRILGDSVTGCHNSTNEGSKCVG